MYHLVLQEQHIKVFHLVFHKNSGGLALACPEILSWTEKAIFLLKNIDNLFH